MKKEIWNFDSHGITLYGNVYVADNPKGIVEIVHGMAEHRKRYEDFCTYLANNGYTAVVYDQRGHGETAGSVEKLGYMDDTNNFKILVSDAKLVNNEIKNKFKKLPVYLLGHSMGSFISQRFIELYGDSISGVILSGTNYNKGLMINVGYKIAKGEVKKHGRKYLSEKMNKLSFASYNNSIKNVRTSFDWLSINKNNVDKYIADPYCGTVFSTSFFMDMLNEFKETSAYFDKIRKDLPIFIAGGKYDPVGKSGKGPNKLLQEYTKKQGIEDVALKLYEARHEILNDNVKKEVYEDILEWLKKH
ncbi:MAG: alpha/beta hydrolase [Bacilli bacterium]